MQVLSNGWHVPDEDEKMFNHVKGDKTKNSPNSEKKPSPKPTNVLSEEKLMFLLNSDDFNFLCLK